MKHLITLENWSSEKIMRIIQKGQVVKAKPQDYFQALSHKTLLMIFEKESLRTRLSFETAMTQLGGHAIYLNVKDAPLGEKENIEDTVKCASRYVDCIMARIRHETLEKIADNSCVPVINAMTDFSHPCQILGDLLTILEKKKHLKGLKLAYIGDANNNITHSLMFACTKMAMDVSVACPMKKEFMPRDKVIRSARKFAKKSKSEFLLTESIKEAVDNADVIYTDTWISYYILKSEREKRISILKKYQINNKVFSYAKKNAIFMHCLPALRGQEVTASVMDGKHSIIFDQAENRLHIQKAILLDFLGR